MPLVKVCSSWFKHYSFFFFEKKEETLQASVKEVVGG